MFYPIQEMCRVLQTRTFVGSLHLAPLIAPLYFGYRRAMQFHFILPVFQLFVPQCIPDWPLILTQSPLTQWPDNRKQMSRV